MFRKQNVVRHRRMVSVPLRGVGCFARSLTTCSSRWFPSPCGVWVVSECAGKHGHQKGFRPLAGCGLFHVILWAIVALAGFPSPCGVWVVSNYKAQFAAAKRFPSPCGVWVVSVRALPPPRAIRGFRPLAGCGLFPGGAEPWCHRHGFRPLAGCGLFLGQRGQGLRLIVSVPLRGVGCFAEIETILIALDGFRPLAGCGLFPS